MNRASSASGRTLGVLAASQGAMVASQAVVWGRLFGSADGNRAATLAHVTAGLLAALALGLLAARPLRERFALGALRAAAALTAFSGAIFYAVVPLSSALGQHSALAGRLTLFAGLGLTGMAGGAALPALGAALHDARSPNEGTDWLRAPSLALLGAAVGVFVVGYVLLDVETLQHSVLIVTLATLGLAQAMWLAAPEDRRRAGVTVFSLAALIALVAQDTIFAGAIEQLQVGPGARQLSYQLLAQRRAGIVGVTPDGRALEDGVAVGSYTIDPVSDVAPVAPAYLTAALHPAPRRILVLGLGTGAWTRILAALPGLDSLTVVEANPAFVDAIWHFPVIASVLDDPRVRLHLDSPRHWLRRHPAARYDVIVVNHPGAHRFGATDQFSAEYLQLLKARLASGGIAILNAGGSLDALYTLSGVWRHVVRVANGAAASDVPFDRTTDARRAVVNLLRSLEGATRPQGDGAGPVVDALLGTASGELAPALRRANDLWNITDDNLAVEFKATGAGAWWRALPARVWRPDRAWPTVLF